LSGHEKINIQSSRMWDPEGISKECGKPASWLSVLSILVVSQFGGFTNQVAILENAALFLLRMRVHLASSIVGVMS